MAVYCGSGNVSEIFCGTNSIAQVYCGTNLVYGTEVADPSGITLTTLTTTGSSISARRGAGMVGDDERALVFGGDTGTIQNDFYRVVFSSTGAAATTISAATRPPPRRFLGMVGDQLNGMIFGGRVAANAADNTFYRYSFSSNTDTSATFTQLSTTGYAIPARFFMGMVGEADSGLIYGGTTDGSANATDFVRYVRTGSSVTLTSLTFAGDTNVPRRQMGMSGNATAGLIFGGYSTTRLNDFVRYTVSGNTVTLTNLTQMGDTISVRNALSMMSIDGDGVRGLIFGGNMNGVRQNDFYYYRVDGNNVHVSNLTKTGSIGARQLANMVGDMTGGIVFGGIGSGPGTGGRYNDFVKYVTTT